jgi:hypothetical protein
MTTAVYAAIDSNVKLNPFVTDGTASGTVELTASGVSNLGLIGSNPDFTVLGTKLLIIFGWLTFRPGTPAS